jgi:nitrogen fixation/metabolism regulation signal transduction histidine kinase
VNIDENQSEIAHVGDAFNTMAEALQDRERQLLRAKEKAEDATDRITAVFESTIDCVVIVDRNWRITYLNQHAKDRIAHGRQLIGIVDRPSDPLDELSRVVSILHVCGCNPLVERDHSAAIDAHFAHHDDSRHVCPFAWMVSLGDHRDVV